MDTDYPFSAFRAAASYAVVRVCAFMAALGAGSLVGEYLITQRWHELALLPMSTIFHMVAAVAQFWGILLLAVFGWTFYSLVWRGSSLLWSVLGIFFAQSASVQLFTPHWMRSDDRSASVTLITKIICIGLAGICLYFANRKLPE